MKKNNLKKVEVYDYNYCLYCFPCNENSSPYLKVFNSIESLLEYLILHYSLYYFYNIYSVKKLSFGSRV